MIRIIVNIIPGLRGRVPHFRITVLYRPRLSERGDPSPTDSSD